MLVKNKNKIMRTNASILAVAAAWAVIPLPVQAEDVLSKVAAMNTLPVLKPMATVNGARPDISALRYYAIRGEQGRVQAEITRLKQLYPSWKQPENIFAEDNTEERALWKLYSEGKTGSLKAEIARLQAEEVSWSPSPELLDKIEQRENRTGIAADWAAKNWDGVIEQANANPALLAGGDIELIWFVAEAYANKERPQDAYLALAAALKSANSQQERKATVQKAALMLSTDRALALLNTTPQLRDDENLTEEVEDAIVRGALARSAEFGEAIPIALVKQVDGFIVRTRSRNSHDDSILLAWSKFGQRDWAGAHEWFTRALAQKQSPKAIEGAIMASMRVQKLDVAAALAGQWLNVSSEIGALFISVHAPALLQANPPAMDGKFLQVYAEKTAELTNGEGAEALGWYAFNVAQLQAADAWFTKAMLWEETETAVYGRALTAVRGKDRTLFDVLKRDYGSKYPSVAALKYQVEVKRKNTVSVKRRSTRVDRAGALRGKISRLHKAGRYSQCLELSRHLRKYGPLRAGDHQMRGWCLMGANRPSEAEQAFRAALRLGGKGKVPSAYGQTLAALRTGKTNEALSIANANRMTKKQRRVIDIELLTQRARAAFANRDYAATVHALNKRSRLTAEPRDLTLLRAWAHYHSGRIPSARALFANLDDQLSTRDTKKGLHATTRKLTKAVSNDR